MIVYVHNTDELGSDYEEAELTTYSARTILTDTTIPKEGSLLCSSRHEQDELANRGYHHVSLVEDLVNRYYEHGMKAAAAAEAAEPTEVGYDDESREGMTRDRP